MIWHMVRVAHTSTLLVCLVTTPIYAQNSQSLSSSESANQSLPVSVPNPSTNLFQEMAAYDSPDSSDAVKGEAALRIAQYLGAKPSHKPGDFYTCIQYFLAASRLGQKDVVEQILQMIQARQMSARLLAISDLYTFQAWAEAKAPLSVDDVNNLKAVQSDLGRIEGVLTGHGDQVVCVAFSPDGKTLASGSRDHSIKLWDMASGQGKFTLAGHGDTVESVAFSPDGKTLASGSNDRSIRLWDVVKGSCLATLTGHSDQVLSVAFSPDGKLLASGSADLSVKLWDLTTTQCEGTLSGHSATVNCVSFNSDGKTLASASSDDTIRLWNVVTSQCNDVLTGQSDQVLSIDYNPNDKTLASSSKDGVIKLWPEPKGQKPIKVAGQHICCVRWSPNGKTLASLSDDGAIQLWDVSTGVCRLSLKGETKTNSSLSFSPDGQILACGGGAAINLWYVGDCLAPSATPSSPEDKAAKVDSAKTPSTGR